MPRISALFTNNGVPVTTPANTPTIRIRRQDTQALVVTDAAMTEQGDGLFTYDFSEDPTLEYVFRCDGDPTAAGQTTVYERYVSGSFSGITETRIETDIPAILVDTDTTIPGLIAALNDLSVSDILTAVLGSGESVDVALSRLDNIDTSVTTTIPNAIAALNDISVADILAALLTSGETLDVALSRLDNIDADVATNIPALIAALNDLSIADVQTALTNQGYTAGRAPNLDNLNAAITTRATVADILAAILGSGETLDVALSRLDNIDADVATNIPALIAALNDLSTADVQTALTNQGYTAARAPNLDNLDAAVSTRATPADIATALATLNDISTADILAAVLASGESVDTALSRLDNMDVAVEKIRKVTTNKVVVNGTDTLVTVYEDDDVTPAFTFTISGDRRTRTP